MEKIILVVLFVLSGCFATAPVSYEKTKSYKKDMRLSINGEVGKGMLIIKPAQRYKIKINAKDKIHLLTLRNCHRSIEAERVWRNNSWFNKLRTNVAEFEIKLNSPIEQNEYCAWDIGAWSKSGRHSWGWVIVTRAPKKYSLTPKYLHCNGNNQITDGFSKCQSFTGLTQEIAFNTEVEVHVKAPTTPIDGADIIDNSRCIWTQTKGKVFRFDIQDDICEYIFYDAINKKRHQLTTHGYKNIMLKG